MVYKKDYNLSEVAISKISEFKIPVIEKVIPFYEEKYLLELKIPSINLEKFVYDVNSSKNNVDYHVEILDSSDLKKNVYFLAGHSGSGSNNYFNDLKLLEIGDFIYVEKDGLEYCYRVVETYFILKNGYLNVDNNLYDTLFLITCSLDYPDKQLIIRAKLV